MSFIDINEIADIEKIPGFRARFLHSENMTIAFWTISQGAILPEHSHPQEQVATIVEGTFELTIGDTTRSLEPGFVAIIPSNVRHSGRAMTDCAIIDVFYPIREDYR